MGRERKFRLNLIEKSQVPVDEPERQFYFMDIARAYIGQLTEQKGRSLTFHVKTFGCQMNTVHEKWKAA